MYLPFLAFPVLSVKDPTHSQLEPFYYHSPRSNLLSEASMETTFMGCEITLKPPVLLFSPPLLSGAEEDSSLVFYREVFSPVLRACGGEGSPMLLPLPVLLLLTPVLLFASSFLVTSPSPCRDDCSQCCFPTSHTVGFSLCCHSKSCRLGPAVSFSLSPTAFLIH